MKDLQFMNLSPVYIEISQAALKALRDESGLELPLDRLETGRLTDPCKAKLVSALQEFLNRKNWQPRVRALCAIGANGVSVRRLALPASAKEEFQRLLLLQIESEFPLPPDELAWGCRQLGERHSAGTPPQQELIVAAVKRGVLEEYASVLSACGLNPVFTLAALARGHLCPELAGSCAMLDIGRTHSELLAFETGFPASVRILSWGVENILKTGAGLDALTTSLGANWTGKKLYITGADDGVRNLAMQLAQRLGNGIECQHLTVASGPGRSAAILGLKKAAEENGGAPPLILQAKTRPANGTFRLSEPALGKWLKPAAILLASLLILPYGEALLFKPFLSKKLSKLKADKGRLSTIDRELSFLQFIKQTEPPYLDAMYVLAKAAPAGARVESLTMNRRGEVSLRASMKDSLQVVEFRARLIDSGFFSTVALEEQAPTPDRQKVRVRISAQWKPLAARAALSIGPTVAEIEAAKTGAKATPANIAPGIGAPAQAVPVTPNPQKP